MYPWGIGRGVKAAGAGVRGDHGVNVVVAREDRGCGGETIGGKVSY